MSDNKNVITCPACNHLMQKIYVPSECIDIDLCSDGCGGIFFDKGEMFKINDDFKHIKDLKAYLDKEYIKSDFIATNDKEPRYCPVCNILMNKSHVANGTVIMDSCTNCGGVFLDRGELEKIRQALSD